MDTFSNDDALDLPKEPSLMDEEYCRRLRPELCKTLLGIYRNAEDAEDAVHEALTDAYGDWQRLQAVSNKDGYVYTMARNKANKARRHKPRKEEAERIFEHRRAHDVGFEPYEGWRREEIISIAEKALSKREMDFFWLVHLERRYTLKQLAERWNYSYGYMRQYASRVYSKLREALQKELQIQG